ncbi:MAG: 2,3-bisphosphoglycerate-independent phosphoglycerate mutase [Deltaproteobacteria bacterium]|nr:2,3-bisphosphoglycerate-independent phosphoglycerate mutase [Deltaproteobacteria bacterium]MBW2660645.1 2,3-bisphosphoglycerate-independent phosphoglycerate mutase [Deltaproteobacteria bacterium]
MIKNKRPCMLMILDGWGIGPDGDGNAVYLARTPCLDKLKKEYPGTRLLCSGEAVGLPKGFMGNSEVGHLNIGAGRIVYQDLLRINMAIRDGLFAENNALNSVISRVKDNNSALHLMGLLSDGGVHSHINHLFALLDLAKNKGLSRVYVHVITDGRDTLSDSGAGYMQDLQKYIDKIGLGVIATVCGRFYAMDRDNRWERVEKAFRLYVLGEGIREKNPVEAVKKAYMRNETDEFISPTLITGKNEKAAGVVEDGDGIIFFNFRSDRAREITHAFTDQVFNSFERNASPKLCEFVCMTLYDEVFSLPLAFSPVHIDGILGEAVSKKGLRQLRIAETEKYAHVTYFFNGGEEKSFPLEDRCLIPSPREVATYDLKPEMSAFLVTEEVISRLQSNAYDLIVLNFANLDMVGHTGALDAAVKACEVIDGCVEKIVAKIQTMGGVVLITADHGNAEKMIDENGHIYTAHTLNPVPFILVDEDQKAVSLKPGMLADIAPTILHIMGIDKPEGMTGESLL